MVRPDRRVAGSLALPVALWAASGPASAHGVGGSGGAVGFPLVVGLALVVGGGAGLAAVVRGCPATDTERGRFAGLAGPALVVLGGAAALTAASRGPVVAGGCVLAGAVLGWLLVRRGDGGHRGRGSCANTALGAVTVHRAVEGVSLAALYATGSALGLAGAVVLAGHGTAETATVGGVFGVSSRVSGVLAVGVVQAAFLGGAVAGVVASGTFPPGLGDATVAAVGGVLLVVGTHHRTGPVAAHRH